MLVHRWHPLQDHVHRLFVGPGRLSVAAPSV